MLLHLPSVEEAYHAAGLLGLRLVVGHHHDGTSVLLVELVKQFHDLDTHLGVQVTGRLIGENDVGVTYDRTGDGYALTLAAGELRREVAHTVARPVCGAPRKRPCDRAREVPRCPARSGN